MKLVTKRCRIYSQDMIDTGDIRIFKSVDGDISLLKVRAGEYELARHSHEEAQFMLVVRGLVSCEVGSGLWLVPPQSALWIPSGMEHSVRGVGDLYGYSVYIPLKLIDGLPLECCVLTVSPLLRELVIALSDLPNQPVADGMSFRIIGAMIDQLMIAQVEQLHLPMPADQRLRQIADQLVVEPSDRTSMSEWSRKIGVSERSLHRLMLKETGLSFNRWRQQFQIVYALQCLSTGGTIQSVAFELGYENSSSFVAMFRKTLGKPPLKFLADRAVNKVRL